MLSRWPTSGSGLLLILAALGLAARRRGVCCWTGLLGGGAGIYLGCMDVLFDLENGIYHVPAGGDVTGATAMPSAVAVSSQVSP